MHDGVFFVAGSVRVGMCARAARVRSARFCGVRDVRVHLHLHVTHGR